MTTRLNSFFESKVEVSRIKHGDNQTVETLINEETMLFARYLRDENPTWHPCAHHFLVEKASKAKTI